MEIAASYIKFYLTKPCIFQSLIDTRKCKLVFYFAMASPPSRIAPGWVVAGVLLDILGPKT